MKRYTAFFALIAILMSSCAGLGMGIVDVDSPAPVGTTYWYGNGYIDNPYWTSPIYGTPPPPPPVVVAPAPQPPHYQPQRPQRPQGPQNPAPGPSQGGFVPGQSVNPGTNQAPAVTTPSNSQRPGGLVGGRR